MPIRFSQPKNKYQQLGDELLRVAGEARSQRWIAEKTFVSQEAVHYWMTGQSRPRPDKLGHIAALFRHDPIQLACLAGYDNDPNALDKLIAAYEFYQADH